MIVRKVTVEEYFAEAVARFGPNRADWKFVCPCCGHVASAAEYIAAGAGNAIGFSCIGRWIGAKRGAFEKGAGPCDYAGGGLFCVSPVEVVDKGFFFELARP